MPTSLAVRKVHENPKPYDRKPHKPAGPNGPKTSACPVQSNKRENLTLHDWMTVLTFIYEHPAMAQANIVKHLASKADGAFIFTQSTVYSVLLLDSCKIQTRSELKNRVNSHLSALSSKWPHVVTRPDVEKALALWVQDMEDQGKSVTGPIMLKLESKTYKV